MISNVIVDSISIGDHELIGCIRKMHNIKYKSKTVRSRDYKNYVHENLIAECQQIDWDNLYQCNDVNTAANIFTSTLKNIFDRHAPIRTKTVKGKPSPWLKKDIKRLIDNKKRLYRKAKKTKTDNDWAEYKTARNKCNGKIQEAKRRYHRDQIEENKKNPKKFWESIKSVFPSKSKSSFPSMQKSKTLEMVSNFSNYFATVVAKLKSKAISFSNYVWKPHHHLQPRKTDKIFAFSYVSKVSVENQLKSMKRKKATGIDELPACMIKDCAKAISQPLTFIVNLSLKSGVFPTVWKRAKINPVYKSGDTGKPENYRPISVFPIFSKILEKAAHGQLSSFLEDNKLLTDFQFGYRQNRSTKLASTLLFDDICNCIDQGKFVGAVYIDLTKAFDTVGHGVLLSKLNRYGISGNEYNWIANYLFNRHHVVGVDGIESTSQPLTSGVPQGSILGPLLFLLFFDDFPDTLRNCRCIMYADDTVVYVDSAKKETIEEFLNADLQHIAKYFDENELFINLRKGKTEAMIFGTGKRLSKTNKHLEVSFQQQPINNVSEYKYLGNVVDQHLNFNQNFDKVYKKASGRLKLLQRLRSYLTNESAYSIYSMMIVPLLTYRSTAKLNHSETQKKMLKSLERRASMVTRVNVPSVFNLINREACCFVKKCLIGDVCENFKDYFVVNQHRQNTRNGGFLLKVPKVRLELGKSTFKFSGTKLYNDLPLKMRKLENYNIFCNEIKQFLAS